MELYFNIWDDYAEGGNTYGYFESDLPETDETKIFEEEIALGIFQYLKEKTWECEIYLDENQINFKNISYEELEDILEYLQLYKHTEHIIHFYSES